MMKTYKSTKNIFFIILIKYVPYLTLGIMLFSLIREYVISEYSNDKILISIIVMGILFGLLIGFVEKTIKTSYSIYNNVLHINSGFSKIEIQISKIQSLTYSSYFGYGRKPGLDIKGLKVIYESGRMMYITPERVEEFINDLKSSNEKIVIR